MKNAIYSRIYGSQYRKIWAVGDLHGCYSLLMKKLDDVGFKPECDLLISVGDLIDRGKENVECLELLQMPWFRAVRGNHEQMMIDAFTTEGDVNHWMQNGGTWRFTLDIDKETLAIALTELVKQLPHIIEVNTGEQKTVIAHAEYPTDTYWYDKPVSAEDVTWSRQRLVDNSNGNGRNIQGADLFIFGHSLVTLPNMFHNQLYIDTGAVFTGNLTLFPVKE